MRIDDLLAEFRDTMILARQRVEAWHLNAEGFEALAGGLAKTYRQAQKAMAGARETGSEEDFHDWRKFVKYHWYHSSLLAPTRPDIMVAHRGAADRLGESLGDLHDLDVLRDRLADEPITHALASESSRIYDLIAQRRQDLAADALERGAELLAEAPEDLTSRWRDYWETWQAVKRA